MSDFNGGGMRVSISDCQARHICNGTQLWKKTVVYLKQREGKWEAIMPDPEQCPPDIQPYCATENNGNGSNGVRLIRLDKKGDIFIMKTIKVIGDNGKIYYGFQHHDFIFY